MVEGEAASDLVQSCTGENTCLGLFEHKTAPGRCHKCAILANSPETEHTRILAIPQCSGCGAISQRLTTEYCGLCANKNQKHLNNQAPSSASPATILPATILSLSQGQSVSASLRNLGQYNRNNWKDAAHINESGIRTQQSTVPITGANMATLRSSNLATNECYVFILEPFVRTKPCTFLSTFKVIRESTTRFSDIVSNGISSLNSSWEQDCEASLVRSDFRFTRMSNVHIEIEPQALFKDVLQLILKDSGQNLDRTAPPKFRRRKFPIVYIEAHIELAKFENRTGVRAPDALSRPQKRGRNTSFLASGSALKRSCLETGSCSLKSSFALHAPMANATTVTLFFGNHITDPTNAVQSITWSPDADGLSDSVMIENIHSGKGKSKFVFKVTYNKLSYVAKRCYTLGNGTAVSIIANRDELIREAITLGRAKFFLDNFKGECESGEIDISDFEVTDFLVAREGVIAKDVSETPSFIPSPASGIKLSDYQVLSDNQKDEIVMDNKIISSVAWLLERERSNIHFRKYSGTLEHPHHTDKQGATINVFQHFTYLNSNKTLVLADIQGSESYNPSNKAGILFDLMSHTHSGDSGAGDHGEDGIQSFVVQHKCGQRCIQMGLEKLGETEEEED
ncbi:kinase-like domain-containing protein [Mycena galericulata]|nr:kinase-like domain-containing protein [Mycena galericulata]